MKQGSSEKAKTASNTFDNSNVINAVEDKNKFDQNLTSCLKYQNIDDWIWK